MVTIPHVPVDIQEWRMCIGCGPDNPIGLHLKFKWDGKTARAEFTPGEVHQGWNNIVHGGITTLLLDEAMGYAAVFENVPSVTAQMETRLRRPIHVGEPLVITASVTRKTNRIVETRAAVTLKDGTVAAESKGIMYIVQNIDLTDAVKEAQAENYG